MNIKSLSIALLALAAMGCDGDPTDSDSPTGENRAAAIAALTGDADAGKTFYDASCSACHGMDGTGGTFLSIVEFIDANEKEDVIGKIIEGPGAMTSYASEDDQTIADVATYALTL